ncbi:hypothetical protein WMY93_033150 [Mugilogobius chulae]|uniref:Uncharacterized protein n=1 Tax=Mugilogobius chulae TaxID=88201 RepID=A0AAW0ML12_9GOBI
MAGLLLLLCCIDAVLEIAAQVVVVAVAAVVVVIVVVAAAAAVAVVVVVVFNKNLAPPTLTAHPAVITETDTVNLTCQSSVPAYQCYFYTLDGQTWENSAVQSVRGSYLLMVNQKPPVQVHIKCYYVVHWGQYVSTSKPSDPAHVTVHLQTDQTTVSQPYVTTASLNPVKTTNTQHKTGDDSKTVSAVGMTQPHVTTAPLDPGKTTDLQHKTNSKGSGPGIHIIAVVCGVVMLCVFVVLAVFCIRRRRKGHRKADSGPDPDPSAGGGDPLFLGTNFMRPNHPTPNTRALLQQLRFFIRSELFVAHLYRLLFTFKHLQIFLLVPDDDNAYSLITAVPGVDCSKDSAAVTRNQSKDTDESEIYHLYSTIQDEPTSGTVDNVIYSSLTPL